MLPEMRLIRFVELRTKASLQERRGLVKRKASKPGYERRVEPVGNRLDAPVIDFCGNCGLVPSRQTLESDASVEEFSLDPAIYLDLPRCSDQSPFRSTSRQVQYILPFLRGDPIPGCLSRSVEVFPELRRRCSADDRASRRAQLSMRCGHRIYDRSIAGLGTGKAQRYFASDLVGFPIV